ncbi:MAG: ArsA family ATPase [Myxacorys californica WJT36-NPBG1]|jgi:arsenite-transporting ATPase|nr:ArsA family ATPase [Myxacorys californica WJT36-NPBG1]
MRNEQRFETVDCAVKPLDALQLAMFSGKGGVGKTTLACGFARHWAQQFPTERILLLSTDPAHSIGDVLQVEVSNTARTLEDLPNLSIRAIAAADLLQDFKAKYGSILELLVERGSFVEKGDLSPVWDLSWPGLDELMGVLEIQRLLRENVVDRIVVDMAPSGHTLALFGLMDFLDEFLSALELFQQKHQVISQSFRGRYTPDEVDHFLLEMKSDLGNGRQLLQDETKTACLVVAIAEWMSLLETQRFLSALNALNIPVGGLLINQVSDKSDTDIYSDQQKLIEKFLEFTVPATLLVPQQAQEPVGKEALDRVMSQVQVAHAQRVSIDVQTRLPEAIPPGFSDFILEGRKLILTGGKGGVGKTTVAAAIALGMAQRYPDKKIRVISIDPAHSLSDALGTHLEHHATDITANLSGQEIDAKQVLDQFREDYLWELAEMMSGESNTADTTLRVAYSPEAWRRIVSQSLPGIDEMLSLIAVMELLESGSQDLVILDTAPTGHLLRFLEMPTALGDWLAWIFKLWIKYQNVLGRTALMGRLRTLRQRVMQAQKKLQDPQYTEFIGVCQARSAILAETQRLTESLKEMGVSQRYLVNNRFEPEHAFDPQLFPQQTIISLPMLPRAISGMHHIRGNTPFSQIAIAASLLFQNEDGKID